MKGSFRFVVVVLLLTNASTVFSQSFYAIRRERSLIGYVGVQSVNYFGELNTDAALGDIRPGLNIGLEHFIANRVSLRLEANWFQMSAADANGPASRSPRNLSFQSNNVEGNFAGTFNLLPNGRRFYQRPIVNLYVFAGIGLLYTNPKALYNGELVALQPIQTEGVKYSKLQPVIPFGGGLKIKTGPFFNIALEAGMRKTFTDYLDDVSSRGYADPATLSSDLARALSNRSAGGAVEIRGNPETQDWYFMATAKLQYYLPYDLSSIRRNKLYTQKRKAYYRRRR